MQEYMYTWETPSLARGRSIVYALTISEALSAADKILSNETTLFNARVIRIEEA
jgi:hypothetical protein